MTSTIPNPSPSVAEVLEAAADLCADGWTQVTAARDAAGDHVAPYSRRAVCWCAEGAIAAVTRHQWPSLALEKEPAWRFLRGELEKEIYEWNDDRGRTQSEVVSKLREAGAKAREQGQ